MMDPKRVQADLERRRLERESGTVEKRKQGRPHKVWSAGTAHNARASAFRVFSWAKDERIINENPFAGMKRPKPTPRQRAMSGTPT